MSASQRIVLMSAGTVITGSQGPGSGVPVASLSMLEVHVNITAVSGTTPKLTLRLVCSADAGTVFIPRAYDRLVVAPALPADAPAFVDKVNICQEVAAVSKFWALFKELPADLVGIETLVSGTNPSFTMGVTAVGK